MIIDNYLKEIKKEEEKIVINRVVKNKLEISKNITGFHEMIIFPEDIK
mgnify:CR=1 FL=1